MASPPACSSAIARVSMERKLASATSILIASMGAFGFRLRMFCWARMMSLVFQEPRKHARPQALGDARIVQRKTVRLLEKVVRSFFRFRRHGLAAKELRRVDTVTLRGAGTGGCTARVHQQHARQHDIVDVPSVDIARPGLQVAQEGSGFIVDDPTLYANASTITGDLRADTGILCRAAERFLVQVRQMGEIEQIVGDQQVIGIVVQIARGTAPVDISRSWEWNVCGAEA
jgi:hypothetical protein